MTSETQKTRPADDRGRSLSGSALEYAIDAWQRLILYSDVIRRRGDVFLDHREKGKPPVLSFKYELVMDGRTLPTPAGYALLRMIPPQNLPTDPKQRPFVIVDPRAGHGPGIGGFKEDSQVGVAMRYRHPVYFVSFFPKPVPGQTLLDVSAVEAVFIEEVIRRHPEAGGKPCVIGNCQAGWAVASLAAIRPELMGPLILNGAPLSYWSGADGKNPMRYAAGLLGGKWLASLASDMGDGLFDGAHLVANFENLNPAHTMWGKQYHLFSKIDTEAERFLNFEKWWGAFFLMNAEEMDAIISDLFIGNKLSSGELRTRKGQQVDLRNIRSPVIIFASQGDNITPPQQALNWIVDVYGHEEEIVNQGRVIVYLVHESIGHLGIFVSGKVARKEHTELIGTLDMIDRLPPGLYEMVIEPKRKDLPHADLETGDFGVRFELRAVEDILALDDGRHEEEYFETVARVSSINEVMYRLWVRPWVRLMATDWSAKQLRHLHPLRMQRVLGSSRNPLLAALPMLADSVNSCRHPVSADNPFLRWQHTASSMINDGLDTFRVVRDSAMEAGFHWIYGWSGIGSLFASLAVEPQTTGCDQISTENSPVEKNIEAFDAGGALAAVARILVAAIRERRFLERRSVLLARQIRSQSRFRDLSNREIKAIIREQSRLLQLDEDRALQALARMLPTQELRLRALDMVREILFAASDDTEQESDLFRKLNTILDMNTRHVQTEA